MRGGWNRGLTKDTHPSLRKTSETMRARKLDNFKKWRDKAKQAGRIKNNYPPLLRNGDLAELIGVVLGDGHIGLHPRCDSLRITATGTNEGFIKRYASLIEKVFGKPPTIAKMKNANAIIITIYERHISERIGIPHGTRSHLRYLLPVWIGNDDEYILRFLRGLYEAEGSLNHHLPTSTHKLIFTNYNSHLLSLVARLVKKLGFTVSVSSHKVQVSRKTEVQKLADLLQFRRYVR